MTHCLIFRKKVTGYGKDCTRYVGIFFLSFETMPNAKFHRKKKHVQFFLALNRTISIPTNQKKMWTSYKVKIKLRAPKRDQCVFLFPLVLEKM